jgi:hypothetical protein
MKKWLYTFYEPQLFETLSILVTSLSVGIGLIMLVSCEKELNANVNYKYTFSALVVKDQWGVETWGSHHFIVDEKIQDVESFKKCYVAYLKRSGKDIDGLYNKIYYQDSKKVKIVFDNETYLNWTYKDMDNCNE